MQEKGREQFESAQQLQRKPLKSRDLGGFRYVFATFRVSKRNREMTSLTVWGRFCNNCANNQPPKTRQTIGMQAFPGSGACNFFAISMLYEAYTLSMTAAVMLTLLWRPFT